MSAWLKDALVGALLAAGVIAVSLFSSFQSTFLYRGF
jgi:hypothetical protein